jgi:hypothetical protein
MRNCSLEKFMIPSYVSGHSFWNNRIVFVHFKAKFVSTYSIVLAALDTQVNSTISVTSRSVVVAGISAKWVCTLPCFTCEGYIY